jgi:hypothetical protein
VERVVVEVAAGGEPEVLAEVGADRLGQSGVRRGEGEVDAGQVKRQSLAEVPEDDLQVGQPVERPAEDEA